MKLLVKRKESRKGLKKAFTLIEIVVAILLFAILLMAALTKLSNFFYENSIKANADNIVNVDRQVAQAVISYKTEKGVFPTDLNSITPTYLDEVPSIKIGDNVVTPELDTSYTNFGDTTKKDVVIKISNVPADVGNEVVKKLGNTKAQYDATTQTLYYLITADVE